MTRPWTPDQVIIDDRGRRGRVQSVKRVCNGCRMLLGDVTETEMVDAVKGRSLHDVTGECGYCQGVHVLVVTPEPRPLDWHVDDGDEIDYEVRCPYAADPDSVECAEWEPCDCTPPAGATYPGDVFEAFVGAPCLTSVTGVHRYLPEIGAVCAPAPGTCWYATSDGMVDAAADIAWTPGVYPIEVDAFDESTPVFHLLDLAEHRRAAAAG